MKTQSFISQAAPASERVGLKAVGPLLSHMGQHLIENWVDFPLRLTLDTRKKNSFALIPTLVESKEGEEGEKSRGKAGVPSCLGVGVRGQAVLYFCHLSLT